MYFAKDIFTSEELMMQFDMKYKVKDADLSNDVIFDSTGYYDHILHIRLEQT